MPERTTTTARRLAADLVNPDISRRHAAYDELSRRGPELAWKLADALDSPDARERTQAARALVELRREEAIPALLTALRDDDVGVRWLSAIALSELGPRVVLPLIRELLLHSESVWLRQGAHHTLTWLAPLEPAVAEVRDSLEHANGGIDRLLTIDRTLRLLESRTGERTLP